MKSKEIVKDLLTKCGMSQSQMADMLGISSQAMWDRLNNKRNKDLTMEILIPMVTALGYKVQIVPRGSKTPDGGYVVE